MIKFILPLFFLGTVLGSTAQQGVLNERINGRVINGENAARNAWPWQISMQYTYNGANGWYHMCGGSLISPKWVMTAAHCVDDVNGMILRIGLGDYNLFSFEGGEQFKPIDLIISHPGWNPNDLSNGNDIALLRLAEVATLNKAVAAAQLPPAGLVLPQDHPCYVTGWGLTSSGGNIASILQQALLPVVDYPHCSKRDWWSYHVNDHMVCAGGDIKSGCQGDSGGPLNCNVDGIWEVHGVVSFGPYPVCNTIKKPTVFTRVSAYIDWIHAMVNSNGGF
ncbi:elastase-1-like [Latimeria chalumnae]|uniref:Peptidase S1 domain-containing protein n=1 Tax=Latimeria chalumnae TaxID=7897 RepID=H3AV43_LATCH|nr:PREDICTED: elastase-1-like [Latimeria chalumnae]|eukprot:XP_006004603.1 PREDICTED: elastase-1-like [Latimeria chalumnae]